MLAWIRELLPKKLEKEVAVIRIKKETEQLERAVKDLAEQAQTLKKERNEMADMLDGVLNKVGGKRR